jgi:hypothetical protein
LKAIKLILCCWIVTINAYESNQVETEIEDQEKLSQELTRLQVALTTTEDIPDKELLLFLAEFTDDQGHWLDPEIFNQKEITRSNQELEEKNNEDLPNNN